MAFEPCAFCRLLDLAGRSFHGQAMAEPTQKLPENVPGRFYVDATCIDCDLCRETAPRNFTRKDAEGHSFVVHQPEAPPRRPPA